MKGMLLEMPEEVLASARIIRPQLESELRRGLAVALSADGVICGSAPSSLPDWERRSSNIGLASMESPSRWIAPNSKSSDEILSNGSRTIDHLQHVAADQSGGEGSVVRAGKASGYRRPNFRPSC